VVWAVLAGMGARRLVLGASWGRFLWVGREGGRTYVGTDVRTPLPRGGCGLQAGVGQVWHVRNLTSYLALTRSFVLPEVRRPVAGGGGGERCGGRQRVRAS
jgi:hypothetical protein